MTTWYKKRTNPEAMAVVRVVCDGPEVFDAIGDIIHRDDMEGVIHALDVSDSTAYQLFEHVDNPFTIGPARGGPVA